MISVRIPSRSSNQSSPATRRRPSPSDVAISPTPSLTKSPGSPVVSSSSPASASSDEQLTSQLAADPAVTPPTFLQEQNGNPAATRSPSPSFLPEDPFHGPPSSPSSLTPFPQQSGLSPGSTGSGAKGITAKWVAALRDLTSNDKYWLSAMEAHLFALKVRFLDMLHLATTEDENEASKKTSAELIRDRMSFFHFPSGILTAKNLNTSLNLATQKVTVLEEEISSLFRHTFEEIYLRNMQHNNQEAFKEESSIAMIEAQYQIEGLKNQILRLESDIQSKNIESRHLEMLLGTKEEEIARQRRDYLKELGALHEMMWRMNERGEVFSKDQDDLYFLVEGRVRSGSIHSFSPGASDLHQNRNMTPATLGQGPRLEADKDLRATVRMQAQEIQKLRDELSRGKTDQQSSGFVESMKAKVSVQKLEKDLDAARNSYTELLHQFQQQRKEYQDKIDALELRARQWSAFLGGVDLSHPPPTHRGELEAKSESQKQEELSIKCSELLAQVQDWKTRYEETEKMRMDANREVQAARGMIEVLEKKIELSEQKSHALSRQLGRGGLSAGGAGSDSSSSLLSRGSVNGKSETFPGGQETQLTGEALFWKWLSEQVVEQDDNSSNTKRLDRQFSEDQVAELFAPSQKVLIRVSLLVRDAARELRRSLEYAVANGSKKLEGLHAVAWKILRQCEHDDEGIVLMEQGQKGGSQSPDVLKALRPMPFQTMDSSDSAIDLQRSSFKSTVNTLSSAKRFFANATGSRRTIVQSKEGASLAQSLSFSSNQKGSAQAPDKELLTPFEVETVESDAEEVEEAIEQMPFEDDRTPVPPITALRRKSTIGSMKRVPPR
ncbi:putative mitochondrial protein [Andalucia godoyi]|uniref:Putative mitochondrial protein n=1 Tax=Andalucia godoyi TaxID=505711 RepID=A0A8K0F263_ANDGO|nr:putative mitochondrial protein [Andalucia godoyi]|eukprot:ANDGO_03945.mRNA.1 putative mitochondrial protein